MVGAILKATNSSFQKGMAFCRNIYVKKVMKLLAFVFEQPSYFRATKVQASLRIYALRISCTASQIPSECKSVKL